jgi:hypothetical protein
MTSGVPRNQSAKLPFRERPGIGTTCPKCATVGEWGCQYDQFAHPDGYQTFVDIQTVDEHLCWSYRCGYVIRTKVADASTEPDPLTTTSGSATYDPSGITVS